jgi:predicted signal transduction protein with EAL and GGDEF domain
VVVEGVEDEAQLAAVRELNSDIAQGYLFSRPVPGEQVPTLLLRHTAQRLARPAQPDAQAARIAFDEITIRKAS